MELGIIVVLAVLALLWYLNRPKPTVETDRFVGSGRRYVSPPRATVVNQRNATAKGDIVGGNKRSSSYDDGGVSNPLHPANPLNPVYHQPVIDSTPSHSSSHGHSSSWGSSHDCGSSSSSFGGGDSGGSCGGGGGD